MGDITAVKLYWNNNQHLSKQYVADLYGIN